MPQSFCASFLVTSCLVRAVLVLNGVNTNFKKMKTGRRAWFEVSHVILWSLEAC